MRQGRGRDLRAYARSTQARLIAGALFILFLVGGGLVYAIYGPAAAGLALVCIAAGLAPVGLIAASLGVLEWLTRRRRDD